MQRRQQEQATSTTVGNGKFIPYSEHGSGSARERKVPFDFAQGMALDFARDDRVML